MSRSRFDQILHTLQYTDKEAPLFFLDHFHEVCQIVDAFNDHYSKGYKPPWLSCIDDMHRRVDELVAEQVLPRFYDPPLQATSIWQRILLRSRFDQILHTLQYTDKEAPLFFLDHFHEVCQIVDAFNDHYSKGYKPPWLSCIDDMHRRVDELVAEQVLPRFYDPPLQATSIWQRILFDCGQRRREANHVGV